MTWSKANTRRTVRVRIKLLEVLDRLDKVPIELLVMAKFTLTFQSLFRAGDNKWLLTWSFYWQDVFFPAQLELLFSLFPCVGRSFLMSGEGLSFRINIAGRLCLLPV